MIRNLKSQEEKSKFCKYCKHYCRLKDPARCAKYELNQTNPTSTCKDFEKANGISSYGKDTNHYKNY